MQSHQHHHRCSHRRGQRSSPYKPSGSSFCHTVALHNSRVVPLWQFIAGSAARFSDRTISPPGRRGHRWRQEGQSAFTVTCPPPGEPRDPGETPAGRANGVTTGRQLQVALLQCRRKITKQLSRRSPSPKATTTAPSPRSSKINIKPKGSLFGD